MEEIYSVGGKLELVISLRDEQAKKKSGRIYVDDFCRLHGIAVLKSGNVNDPESILAVREHQIDWLFIIGWSQIARAEVLTAPRRGVLGMHPTLLPEGRGRAAVPWAILKNLTETGVTLFQLDEGVDTGPVLAQHRIPIARDETATTLYTRVQEAHRRLISQVWDDLVNDRIRPAPQDHTRATEWPGRTPEDGRITADMTVIDVERLVRAVTHPYPGAFWDTGSERIRIWSGRITQNGGSESGSAFRIHLADGDYDALEYQREPL
jgi:methionyl-tRNA formyltransferase